MMTTFLSFELFYAVLWIVVLGIFLFRLWKVSTVLIQTGNAIMRYIEKKINDTDA